MEITKEYEWVKEDKVWQFSFSYKEEQAFLAIPMDIRGYFARYKEQYDWVNAVLDKLGHLDEVEEVAFSDWGGPTTVLQQVEEELIRQGAKPKG